MGMDDREPNLGETFATGDRFVLTGGQYAGTINTRYGEAEKSLWRIVSRAHPSQQVTYSALGVGLANQARRAERADFPRVVELVEIPTGAGSNRVKRFVKVDVDPRAFIEGDDGPPLAPDQVGMEPLEAHAADDQEHIPF